MVAELPFDLSHALSCRRGGLVIQCHNEVRDAFGDLGELAWEQVVKEPIVEEATTSTPALIANLAVSGAWTPQTECIKLDYFTYRYPKYHNVIKTVIQLAFRIGLVLVTGK